MMTASPAEALDLATNWLTAFGSALESRDPDAIAGLFAEDSHWRDLVALTWDNRQISGRDGLVERFAASIRRVNPRDPRLSEHYSGPTWQTRTGREVIETFFEFDTDYGTALGLVRILSPDAGPDAGRAWMLLTQIESVRGAQSVRGGPRPSGVGYDKKGGTVTWADRRQWSIEFADREPDVLIVGGGQAGVMVAAHLNRLGVDNLVIDSHARVGGNWRTRYDSLQLHNQTPTVQFPYMPFPDVFPEYIPKDKLANWFEDYVDALEINFWTSTPFTGAVRDDDGRWTVSLERAGVTRTLRPRHIVVTTGGTGTVPLRPQLPGLENFGGRVIHSKEFRTGSGFAGESVLVVGVGTSAHDIAYTLVQHGAEVTMLQRGSVTVTSLESANDIFGAYSLGLPIVEVDAVSALGWIEPIQRVNLQESTRRNDARDAALLDGLRAAGMRLDDGIDGTGWIRKFISRGGGYYIDVGASALIVDGTVAIIQSDDLVSFSETGVAMTDGSTRRFDTVVLATGFQNQEAATRQQFGDEIADRIGRIGGYDDEAEVRNTWRTSGQPGLYFGSGSIQFCRTFTPLFSMMLTAEIRGLAPVAGRQPEAVPIAVG